jgi:diguanylate cyclase (GGDEF)-like protein
MSAGDCGMEKLSQKSELEILQTVAKNLTSSLEIKEVLNNIMEIIAEIFKPEDWSLLMLDEEREELYFEVTVGRAAKKLKDVRLKLGEGIAGWAAKNAQPLILDDAYDDERFAKWGDQTTGFKTRNIAAVPLISKGKVLGVIELVNTDKLKDNGKQLQLLSALADFAAIAIENARFVSKVRELTIIDDVTGLYNSRHLHSLLETEISRSVRYDAPFSLIFMDLDYFKMVNDTHGHLIGSRLLGMVGHMLRYNLRTIDWALRYGGDEFILILPQTGKPEALLVCRRLRKALNDAVFFEKEGLNIHIAASWGIATYPDDANDKEGMIKLSDQSMYLVKRSGRNGIAVSGAGIIAP